MFAASQMSFLFFSDVDYLSLARYLVRCFLFFSCRGKLSTLIILAIFTALASRQRISIG
jgi:hypothetical protein